MLLILDKPGTYVSKEGRTLRIKLGKEKMEPIAVKNLSEVIVLTKVNISYDALILLAKYGVPVIFCSRWEPKAVFHPFFHHGTVITRREQMRALYDKRGIHLAKKFAIASLENKISILRYYRNLRSDNSDILDIIDDAIIEIKNRVEMIDNIDEPLDKVRMRIMGLEGEGAQKYFSAIKYLLPGELGFNGRYRRPPLDPVNASLSFGYAIIYSRTLIAIAAAGLEPYAGFLHTDRSGKPSLILDLSEEFKQWLVDRTVLSLFNKRVLKADFFEKRSGGIYLNDKGKKALLEALGNRLSKKVKISQFKGKVNPMTVIIAQARKIVRYLLGIDSEYRPFIWEGR